MSTSALGVKEKEEGVVVVGWWIFLKKN